MNTHEKPWAPRRTHEFTCIPVMFSCFFETMQLANYMFNHCLYNFWFSILFVWSCIWIRGVFLMKRMFVFGFHPALVWHPEKTNRCHCCKTGLYTHTDIHTHIYIYIVCWFASRVGLPHPIQDPSEIFACGCTTSFLASKMWNMSNLILVNEKWRNVAKEWMCQMLQDRPNIFPIWHRISPTRLDM